ncbi:putative phosphatase [Candidatus Rhodobacter oscarellae]|uniref:Putative phosphatase n=1 Tax=Candidatus Rhodobacter oscarellae TaxID=1675527 RepID=A0A0J9E9B9_9RHOB|nr:PhoX family phosphatase [Candidatus Rhodobacter lobularis]KMW58264.1 putative phosphatase [Candidatus Rhodobacter lobularis]
MRDELDHGLTMDDWDEANDPRPETSDFDRVVDEALSRRGFLGGIVAFGSGAAVMGTGTLLGSTSAEALSANRFPFTPIGIQTDATVHVPEGYSWSVVARWGDALTSDAEPFDPATGHSTANAAKVFGENTDGMWLYSVDGHELLAVNNEYANRKTNLPGSEGVPQSLEDVQLLQGIQGVTVLEVAPDDSGAYQIVVDSPFNRRIDHNTPMQITGPAAGHDMLKTAADPTGTMSLGTMNNCGSGPTPWGTYLTCEENFNGYFGSTDADLERTAGQKRYGIGIDGWGYDYHKHDPRFDISQNPNEPHRAGWVVEIDPADPASTPKKRTGLGRIKHENAACVLAPSGHVVVYMGDDERGEYMYKYVSNATYAPGGDTEELLNDGTLYAAKFHADGTGDWLPLTPATTGMDAGEILIHTRMAASAVGATTMDRPEWVAVNPVAAEGYCALTNNKNRGVKPNAGGDDTSVNGPNPREANNYGQIVRWFPANDDHATESFRWDLYVMAGNPVVGEGAYKGSSNVNPGNMFNSPDGMMFDSAGLLWIQTDGDDDNEGEFEGQGNNQMLAGDPVTGEIQRFLTGPNGSEVTGLCWSTDKRTAFVGIQHPGGSFPDGSGLPRSCIVAVWRDDGGLVG